mmetsp:Transcript_19086/g.53171  ORF Transcript_19086/g.53171 Transcript_19086/m.53171 type:complete len:206 (-) Transcript_19086:543-1160(-)
MCKAHSYFRTEEVIEKNGRIFKFTRKLYVGIPLHVAGTKINCNPEQSCFNACSNWYHISRDRKIKHSYMRCLQFGRIVCIVYCHKIIENFNFGDLPSVLPGHQLPVFLRLNLSLEASFCLQGQPERTLLPTPSYLHLQLALSMYRLVLQALLLLWWHSLFPPYIASSHPNLRIVVQTYPSKLKSSQCSCWQDLCPSPSQRLSFRP